MKKLDKPQKLPKDLGIKIGTKLEALWTTVRDEALVLIKQSENNLIIQKEMLKLAKSWINAEKKK